MAIDQHGIVPSPIMRKYINRIRRRMEYLQDSVAADISEGYRPNDFVTAEIEALQWAIPVLEAEWDNNARLRFNLGRVERRLAAVEKREGPDAIDTKPTDAWVAEADWDPDKLGVRLGVRP